MQFGISEAITHWAKYQPDRIAFMVDGRTMSFRELNSRINSVSNKLAHLQPHTRVATIFGSQESLLIAILGVVRSRHTVVILNSGLSLESLQSQIQDCEVSTTLYDEQFKAFAEGNGTVPLKCLVDESEEEFDGKLANPSDDWGVFFSSGTSATPKGILRSHESVVAELVGWCLELGINRNMRFFIGRPMFYTGGLVLALSTLMLGGAIFFKDKVDDDDAETMWNCFQRTLESSELDYAFFIPTQLRKFVSFANKAQKLSAKVILTMGEPISGNEKKRVRAALKSKIVESWGNTESLGTITDPEDLDVRPDSIGRPFLTDEMWVVDENRKRLPPGTHGWIAGSTDSGFTEYCSLPCATADTIGNGMLISQDIGYQDEDGYFYIVGRSNECVAIDGNTYSLPGIEGHLRQHPSFEGLDFCVVFVEAGQPKIAIVSNANIAISIEKLNEYLKELNPHFESREIVVVEKIPKLSTGKLDREKAKALA